MSGVLKSLHVLSHVTEAVEVAADAADVAERGQQPVEPKAAAQAPVFHVRLAQFGVRLPVGRQADVLAQPARLLDEVHVGHDLRRHLAEPLGVDRRHGHRHEEDEDLAGRADVTVRGTIPFFFWTGWRTT